MEPKIETLSETERTLVAAMRAHPEFQDELRGLVAEMKGAAGAALTADDAEDAIATRLQRLGQTVLANWAQARHEAIGAAQPAAGHSRHAKKNSAG